MPSVRETLDQLERELLSSIAELRGKLVPLEGELADVRRAKAALVKEEALQAGATVTPEGHVLPAPKLPLSPYAALTMKELALKALKEQFPNGATANQLIEHFHNAWARTDIKRSSLSPQLSRLKTDGDIDLRGNIWFLVPKKDEAPPAYYTESAPKNGEGGSSPMSGRTGGNLFDC